MVNETNRQSDTKHLLYGGNFTGSPLKLRQIFFKTTISPPQPPEVTGVGPWKDETIYSYARTRMECLPPGESHLPWSNRETLYRSRT